MFLFEISRSIETNVPLWLAPRLGLAILRAGPDGIVTQLIDHNMVTSFTTIDGAQVLNPNWESINPILFDMFGQ